MRIRVRNILAFTFLVCVGVWAADPQTGKWKLNPAKSKPTADHPTPNNLVVTIKDQAGGMVLDAVGEDATGKPIHVQFNAKFDGKDYPVTGAPDADTVSVKRIDANTIETTNKKTGQVTSTIRSVVSQDGKTRTSTWTGKDSKGNPETWTAVYDKQ